MQDAVLLPLMGGLAELPATALRGLVGSSMEEGGALWGAGKGDEQMRNFQSQDRDASELARLKLGTETAQQGLIGAQQGLIGAQEGSARQLGGLYGARAADVPEARATDRGRLMLGGKEAFDRAADMRYRGDLQAERNQLERDKFDHMKATEMRKLKLAWKKASRGGKLTLSKWRKMQAGVVKEHQASLDALKVNIDSGNITQAQDGSYVAITTDGQKLLDMANTTGLAVETMNEYGLNQADAAPDLVAYRKSQPEGEGAARPALHGYGKTLQETPLPGLTPVSAAEKQADRASREDLARTQAEADQAVLDRTFELKTAERAAKAAEDEAARDPTKVALQTKAAEAKIAVDEARTKKLKAETMAIKRKRSNVGGVLGGGIF